MRSAPRSNRFLEPERQRRAPRASGQRRASRAAVRGWCLSLLLVSLVFSLAGPGLGAASGPADSREVAETAAGDALAAAPLLVRLYDPYGLLSRPALERLRAEAAEAFESSGASIRFVRRGGPRVVPATLYPEIPTNWRVNPQTLGVAVGSPGERRSVFLSVQAARRALGWRGPARGAAPGAGRPAVELGTALGRVLAHELLHTVAPDCPHTSHGIMAARLNRRMLTSPGIGFDETAGRYLRRGLSAYGGEAVSQG